MFQKEPMMMTLNFLFAVCVLFIVYQQDYQFCFGWKTKKQNSFRNWPSYQTILFDQTNITEKIFRKNHLSFYRFDDDDDDVRDHSNLSPLILIMVEIFNFLNENFNFLKKIFQLCFNRWCIINKDFFLMRIHTFFSSGWSSG